MTAGLPCAAVATADGAVAPCSEGTMLGRGRALLFAVASGLAVANVYYAQPLLDAIADEFGLRRASAGAIVTLTQVGYALGLLLIVPLGDLVNRRRLIIGQSLLLSLALAAVAAAPNAGFMLAAMAAVGMLAVVTQGLVAHAATLVSAQHRGRTVGTVTSGIVVGILLARTVAGSMADGLGWRSVYLASALATAGVTALLVLALPDPPSQPPEASYIRLIGSMFQLLVDEPVLRRRGVLAMLVFAAMTLLLTPLVLPLTAPPFGLSHTQVGLFGLAGAAGALGASRAGRAADLGRAQRTTGVGLAIMLMSWPCVALLPWSLGALVVGVVTIDFGLQSVHVANQSLIYRVRPQAQSRLTAAYMLFYSFGSAAGSMASTLLYAHAGWTGVCAAGASTSTLALLFWAWTARRSPAAGPRETPEVPSLHLNCR